MQADFTHNIRNEVTLQPDIASHWLDIIGKIAINVRSQQGFEMYISTSDEIAQTLPSGNLIVSMTVSGHRLEMEVPAGFWHWNAGANNSYVGRDNLI